MGREVLPRHTEDEEEKLRESAKALRSVIDQLDF
jgi:L-lactate dehydrogenase